MATRTHGAAAAGKEPASYPALIQTLGRPASTTSSCGAIPHTCAIETNSFGPLTITSKCTKSSDGGTDLSRPDVTSLSVLRLGSNNVDDGAQDGEAVEEEEIALFGGGGGDESAAKTAKDTAASTSTSSTSSGNDNEYNDKSACLLRLLPSLPGIQDRLTDAATSSTGTTINSVGQLELFLSRSEAVVTELLSAIDQYRQRQARAAAAASASAAGRKRKRSGNGTSATAATLSSFSVSYYAGLLQQLSALETIPNIVTVDTSDDLVRVVITCHDEAKRIHELIVELPPCFPFIGGGGGGRSTSRRKPIIYCDLPHEFDPSWKNANAEEGGGGTGSSSNSGGSSREIWIDDDYAVIGNTIAAGRRATSSTTRSSALPYGLPYIYQQFRKVLTSYQTLWNDLDELDRSAWILEPALPANRAISERRIALKPGLSLALMLDADRPRAPPLSARLVGSSVNAAGLRERVAAYVDGVHPGKDVDASGQSSQESVDQKQSWDETQSVKFNLETMLGFDLPSQETTEKADYVAECGICYAHRLPHHTDVNGDTGGDEDVDDNGDGAIPDAMCGNPSCARSYHESCLFEWLHSLPDARVSFDRVFGTCPYCSEGLSVRVLKGTK